MYPPDDSDAAFTRPAREAADPVEYERKAAGKP
jgi:hypothetical protein